MHGNWKLEVSSIIKELVYTSAFACGRSPNFVLLRSKHALSRDVYNRSLFLFLNSKELPSGFKSALNFIQSRRRSEEVCFAEDNFKC